MPFIIHFSCQGIFPCTTKHHMTWFNNYLGLKSNMAASRHTENLKINYIEIIKSCSTTFCISWGEEHDFKLILLNTIVICHIKSNMAASWHTKNKKSHYIEPLKSLYWTITSFCSYWRNKHKSKVILFKKYSMFYEIQYGRQLPWIIMKSHYIAPKVDKDIILFILKKCEEMKWKLFIIIQKMKYIW